MNNNFQNMNSIVSDMLREVITQYGLDREYVVRFDAMDLPEILIYEGMEGHRYGRVIKCIEHPEGARSRIPD